MGRIYVIGETWIGGKITIVKWSILFGMRELDFVWYVIDHTTHGEDSGLIGYEGRNRLIIYDWGKRIDFVLFETK